MSSVQRAATFLALAFVLFASTVSANKGPNQQIVFTNETAWQIGVTTNGTSPTILAAVGPGGSAAAFQAAGGVVINGGGNFSSGFSVQAGTYTLLAADFNQPITGGGVETITQSQTVAANQSVNVYVKGTTQSNSTGALVQVINFSPTP